MGCQNELRSSESSGDVWLSSTWPAPSLLGEDRGVELKDRYPTDWCMKTVSPNTKSIPRLFEALGLLQKDNTIRKPIHIPMHIKSGLSFPFRRKECLTRLWPCVVYSIDLSKMSMARISYVPKWPQILAPPHHGMHKRFDIAKIFLP